MNRTSSKLIVNSSEDLGRLERENPLAATVLHRFLLKRIGQRLIRALETVDELSG